jgi:putative ABC transport system ATP-binding protein
VIQVKQVEHTYGPETTLRFPDFVAERGEHLLLIGESGSGKTTLLHLMGGLLRLQKGSIVIHETDLSTLSEAGLDRFRGKSIGFVFQKNHLISSLSVKKNLLLAPYLAGSRPDGDRIDSLLESLGLENKKASRVSKLSQGQAQRVAIARAMINKPGVILADEPTSALDDRNCERVMKLLLEAAFQSQSTLVIATHDQRLKDRIRRKVILE